MSVRLPVEEWGVLYAAFMMAHKVADRTLAVWGLTVPQASVLGLLGAAGRPLQISEIGRTLMQENQSASTLVDRMCARGLVERIKDPRNRHLVLVRMTDEGARMHEILRTNLPVLADDDMFSVLSPEDRATLAKLLLKFVELNIQRFR